MGGSSDDAGLFEFDQLSDPGSGTDPPDPPDPPDDGSDERAVAEESTTTGEAEQSAASSPGSDDSAESSADGGSSSGSDAPDPPDPSDGGSGSWNFDPVEESQAAFQFAEQQSRAAAESAYGHVLESPLGWLIKRYTNPEVRKRLDEVFSRRMLGSVMVGGAFSKIIESVLGASLGSSSVLLPIAWTLVFLVATLVFVWWEQLARQANEAAEKASEAASEAAEKASETAEKASEAASEAASGKDPSTKTSEMVGAGVTQAAGNREEGATAAIRAGGRRPTAVRSRSRRPDRPSNAPDRRPNERFDDGTERGRADDAGDDVADADPFEGSGFENPADAVREGSGR